MKKSEVLEAGIRSIILDKNPGRVYINELKNEDEYEAEINEILKLFTEEMPEAIFIERVYKLFLNSFAKSGKIDNYKIIAKDIWDALKIINSKKIVTKKEPKNED